MQAIGCPGPVWDGQDWNQCVRDNLFNAALPAAAISISLISLVAHSVRRSHSLVSSAEQVAKLDPAASSFSFANGSQADHLPGAPARSAKPRGLLSRLLASILPWNSSRLLASSDAYSSQTDEDRAAAQAALQVFHTENAVILNEVHQNPLDRLNISQKDDLQRLELIRRIVQVGGAIVLASLHAALAVISDRSYVHQALWAAFCVYLALLGAFSLASTHSLFSHKTALLLAYFVVNAFNLRSALIATYSKVGHPHKDVVIITAAQMFVALLTLIPTVFFPLRTRLPRDLRAIYQTISPEKEHGEPGTVVPSPTLQPVDAAHANGNDGLSSEHDKQPQLITPPEDSASLYSRLVFGFVTPAIRKHYRVQFTMPAVPDLPVADKAAAVVSIFRANTSTGADGKESRRRRSAAAPVAEELKPSTKPLYIRLFRHFAGILMLQLFWAFLEAILVLSPAFFLNKILSFINERGERRRSGDFEGATPLHVALLYAFGMLFGQIFSSISASQGLFIGRRICIRLRAILITEIVTKTLRRRDSGGSKNKDSDEDEGKNKDDNADESSPDQKKDDADAKAKAVSKATDGQVINLISVDVFKVSEICAYLHYLFPKAPLTIGLCIAYLISLLGWSAVLGVMVLVAVMPFQALVSSWFVRLQRKLLETTDRRLNLATEVLNCIKTVKFFAWEEAFNQRMDKTRQQELRVLAFRYAAWLCNTFTYMGTPMLVTCVTFGAHTKIFHKPLTAETAFTALALFNTLRNPLDWLPDMIVQVLNSLVSVRRIDAYLREEETTKYQQLLREHNDDRLPNEPEIGFQDASFCYTDDDEAVETGGAFALKDLNLNLPVGKLTVIAGPVGSGKSSLLLSLLGETRQLSGKTFMPCPVARALTPVDPTTGLSESVAYCSQSPWLLGTTVKENILFGSKFDYQRYRAVIKACALEPDLKILEYGDETEVGEKGTSLSGGQKARIALARALYSSAKHVLIDDALSAVDSHTAKHLYQHALKGALAKGRTILLVTHAISLCLPGAAFAVAMDDGRVVAAGPPDVVNATGVFSEEGAALQHSLKKNGHADGNEHEELTIEQLAAGGTEAADREEMLKKLEKKKAHTNEETYSSGSVGGKTYWLYLSSITTSPLSAILIWTSIVCLFIAIRLLDLGAGAWLMKWAASHENRHDDLSTVQASGFASANVRPAAPVVASLWSNGAAGGSARDLRLDSFLVSAHQNVENFDLNSTDFVEVDAPVATQMHARSLNQQVAFDVDSMIFSDADSAAKDKPRRERTRSELDSYYLLIYLAISATFVVVGVFRDAYEFALSLQASRSIYRKLMGAVLRARPQFFDRTPVGRIMNRLSKDVETVDQEIVVCLLFLLDCTMTCAAILLLICWATPAFAIAALAIIATYYAIGSLYLVSSRDLKRIESVERSPIYTVVGEVLAGCVTIRAFGDAGRFTRHTLRLIDKANRAFFFLWYENRWLSIRVDVAGAFVAFLAAVFLLLRADVEAGLAGFILAYAITFVDSVLWVVRMYTQTEINMNSVERIGEYLELESEKLEGVEPPAYWPSSEGSIVVDNLSVRYTPELPKVLNQVKLEILPREKVGIVGRTGSGKSTLALCFFRFLEAEEGAIIIDGLDISKVPLKTLRQRLTVIPQDAQLFSGTVRSNLDPFNVYEDADLWRALQQCRLASMGTPTASQAVSRAASRPASPGADGEETEELLEVAGRTNVITSLDAPVEQGGRNFSAGQKQLLALARGLLKLKDSRILVLDESTANLDSASDAQIQKTIRQEMAPQATIITIAHRIKTIADYDKICVLDKGKVIEFGRPLELMEKEGGVFQSMCEQSGEMEELRRLARGAEERSTTGQ